jgi:rSAM/selenodomain-associated transferase 1
MKSPMKHLVLIGGGHSHWIALRLFGLESRLSDKITLITDVVNAPYSGMLPGYIRGYYRFSECHIDLRKLAQLAGAQLIVDRAIGLDLNRKRVLLEHQDPIDFDLLSIDIGSRPAKIETAGAAAYAIPAKPIAPLLAAWQQLLEAVEAEPELPLSIGIVGGGAGGIELALNMQGRLAELFISHGSTIQNLSMHLFHRQNNLLSGYPAPVGQRLQRLLIDRGIQLHLNESVRAIERGDASGLKRVCGASGRVVDCHHVFWVTNGAAPSWIKESGLATDERGFIAINDQLQSISHPGVFATGDIATVLGQPRPKAGVFAVRQGRPLFQNLRCVLEERELRPFYPQRRHLALIGCGDGRALATWGQFYLGPGAGLWRWKDRIDRQFMAQFPAARQELLIVFTRYPEPGRVKTRLIPALGEAGATTLHRQMAEHTLERSRQLGCPVEVWFEGGTVPQMAEWLGEDLGYRRQPAGDLGDRMAGAMQDAMERGYEAVVIIGTDCPGLDRELLGQAFGALGDKDLVLGPAVDGGYYLIGLGRLVPELFRWQSLFEKESISWSTAEVFRQTDEIAANLGLQRAYLATLGDVDRPEDLAVWQCFMNNDKSG